MEEIKSIRISELKDFKNHPFMYGRTWNYNGGTYMIISERIFT